MVLFVFRSQLCDLQLTQICSRTEDRATLSEYFVFYKLVEIVFVVDPLTQISMMAMACNYQDLPIFQGHRKKRCLQLAAM